MSAEPGRDPSLARLVGHPALRHGAWPGPDLAAVTRAAIQLKPALAGLDLRARSSFATTAEPGYRCGREGLDTGRPGAWT